MNLFKPVFGLCGMRLLNYQDNAWLTNENVYHTIQVSQKLMLNIWINEF